MSGDTTEPVAVTEAVARGLAPPRPQGSAHKGSRGCVLAVGGSAETPGAILLAGIAALRAGAGILQVATVRSVASHLATAVPEARVIGLDEGPGGDIAGRCAGRLVELARDADAVLIGPGVADDNALRELVAALLRDAPRTALVVDARALAVVSADLVDGRGAPVVLTPNHMEAAGLLDTDADEVEADPARALAALVDRFRCTVSLRGGETLSSAPGQPVYRDTNGSPGLGTSGSGDVLAGFLTGLIARGTPALAAAVWAVHVHARSGQRLSTRIGELGFLARELLDEMGSVAAALSG